MRNSAIDAFAVAAGLVEDASSQSTWLEVSLAVAELGLVPGGRVLDLPCGNGRHAFLLATLGMRVTAVDVEPETIEMAQRRHAHPHIEYRVLDARSSSHLDTKYDAAVSFFSCLGYMEDEAQDCAALQAMVTVLRPGGGLLLSTANGVVVGRPGVSCSTFNAGHFQIERIDTYDPDSHYLMRQYLVNNAHSGEHRIIVHRRRLYDPTEVLALLARAGITGVKCVGDFASSPFLPGHSRHAIYFGNRGE